MMMIQTLFEAREMCEDGMHGTNAGGRTIRPLAPNFEGLLSRARKANSTMRTEA